MPCGTTLTSARILRAGRQQSPTLPTVRRHIAAAIGRVQTWTCNFHPLLTDTALCGEGRKTLRPGCRSPGALDRVAELVDAAPCKSACEIQGRDSDRPTKGSAFTQR
jgi:hypothetical protein